MTTLHKINNSKSVVKNAISFFAITAAITLREKKHAFSQPTLFLVPVSLFRETQCSFPLYIYVHYRWIERRDIHFVSFDGDEMQTRAYFSLPSLFLSVRLWISPTDNYNEWTTTGVRSVCSRLACTLPHTYMYIYICKFSYSPRLLRMLSLSRNFNALSVFLQDKWHSSVHKK